jgi:hypothetical protein
MVDLIVQSGRYTGDNPDLSSGFLVEGERRFWIHLAIDRFTGEIIDREMEAVHE